MRVVLFGATGMIGQGVLRECLLAPDVESVLSIGRAPTGQRHEKLREIVHKDLLDLSSIQDDLGDQDACFFCLGVSSTGMSEADYRRITYDVTMAAGHALAPANPDLTFIYVSGAGTGGRAMWAQVKGQTEDALLALYPNAYMFRPGFIRAMHGATSRTRLYRVMYRIVSPVVPLIMRLFPKQMTTTERIGLAMLNVARQGAPKRILDPTDINALA
ncbi:NAD-dependent epimerase/dehydratase family protein [Phytohabitans rumicis]|uniref:Epimerase n=1 Tax=Phytohabitans rumicis TaxID=1076125 RepID=A0A6V8L3U0_9ACTN|nr:NAD-dependent epimerase/dehydratase family protein [Phytohabitans rumicis]GFJ91923.1 epimerase [Phytohabitans rumicis]